MPTPVVPADSPVTPAGFVDTESATNAAPIITQSDIDAKIKEVTEIAGLDEATKKEALERLKSATEWLKTAKEAAEKPSKFQAEIDAAPNELRDAKQTLAVPKTEPQFQIYESTPLPQIEQATTDAEARLKLAKETLQKREESVKRRSDRKAELTRLGPETEKAFEEAKKALALPYDATSLLESARRSEAEAKFLALERQRTLFPLESKRLESLAELTPLQRDIAKREVEFAEKEAAGWQKLLAEFRKRDSNRQAAEARRQLQAADPALRSLAERNAELAEQRESLVALIDATGREVQQANQIAEKIRSDFAKMEEKVKRAGNSTTIGLLLRRQRDQLPPLTNCRERLRSVETETPTIHLSLLDLQDERELLDDREAIINGVLSQLSSKDRQFDDASYSQMIDELLTTKVELLNKLIRDHDEYLRLLSEMEVAQNELVARTQESEAFIDERVLWIRSSEPISLAHFSQAWIELQNLSQPAQWAAVLSVIKKRVTERPLLAVLAILAVVLMILCRDRFRRQINRICEADSAELRGHFIPTIEAIIAASLATAFWPGLMWLVGWQLQTTNNMPELGVAVGLGFQSAAYAFWLCQFARQLCRHNGIAERHFEWDGRVAALARRNLSWLSAIGIPCVFFISAVTVYRDGEWSSFLGRVGFLVGMATLAAFAHSTLRIGKSRSTDTMVGSSRAWLAHLRHAIYFLGIGVPIILASLTALGYDYSAQQIALRLQATASVVFAVTLGQALAQRWLSVRRHRLDQAAALVLVEEEGVVLDSEAVEVRPSVNPAPVDDHNDAELRYLLRYAVAATLLVGGYFVWADVTPALGVLDQVEISSKSVEVKQTVTDPDGTAHVLTSHKEVKTTLKHAIIACLLLTVGLLVARTLPALVDVLILERMPIDKGQRYAAGMIVRYLLTLTTVAMACLAIGLSWSSIQWLAAAMTVGLGFGLQEIFANLVSGLIILFERPVRVGDLVTVGGVSGRVTRMQIRATTITGFDRRELIVPNKKFITEDVMNWTLSDDVNRIVIEVGVAYGSDTKLVRELLLKAARQQPQVLADPEPIATFDRFADSSLNFTLRCFLPNLDDRLTVIHELHSEIDRAFRKANIEIAFPQQDLHVRTVDVPLRKVLSTDESQKGAA
ncbi:MAG: mechanosensitive ion channel [Planctomycetaceae bacterium]|nr:mechanosensitive ion channel [Planctomycetales bacterium]MCB9926032.1 mechanosensitive ion channel [Planctomycetaceae bacterium]